MECYALKGYGDTKDYMQIVKKLDDGFIVKIVRDMDGYDDITTDFMSQELFDTCIRTGYIYSIFLGDLTEQKDLL